MKKLILMALTAMLLLTGCGEGSGGYSNSMKMKEELIAVLQ